MQIYIYMYPWPFTHRGALYTKYKCTNRSKAEKKTHYWCSGSDKSVHRWRGSTIVLLILELLKQNGYVSFYCASYTQLKHQRKLVKLLVYITTILPKYIIVNFVLHIKRHVGNNKVVKNNDKRILYYCMAPVYIYAQQLFLNCCFVESSPPAICVRDRAQGLDVYKQCFQLKPPILQLHCTRLRLSIFILYIHCLKHAGPLDHGIYSGTSAGTILVLTNSCDILCNLLVSCFIFV